MAFKKASPQQARFKAGFYGKQGSGKTFTALLVAEGLAKRDGKRIAYVDTERGTDFYSQSIKERAVHSEGFDFDAIYTRSIYEVIEEVEALDTSTHSVIVVDSITHLWEAAQAAYAGKKMANGQIPVYAWGAIKKPYKKLMSLLLSGNFHAIICGREGVVMEEDDDGQTKVVGTKMKAEGETAYEPHLLARFRPQYMPDGSQKVAAFFEKDRSGILTNKTISEPDFSTFAPMLSYLSGDVQGAIAGPEETASRDAESAEREEERKRRESAATFSQIKAAITGALDTDQLKAAWGLMKGKKTLLGEEYATQLEQLKDTKKGELVATAAGEI